MILKTGTRDAMWAIIMNIMKIRTTSLITIALLILYGVGAASLTIPQDKVDEQRIFYGSSMSFERPGSVNYQEIVRSTPEYIEIRDKKIENGTARYWILMSEASNRAVQLISSVGRDSEYDLIVASGYLESLEPPIETEDITKLVLKKLEEKSQK